jgi:hypothetical protein
VYGHFCHPVANITSRAWVALCPHGPFTEPQETSARDMQTTSYPSSETNHQHLQIELQEIPIIPGSSSYWIFYLHLLAFSSFFPISPCYISLYVESFFFTSCFLLCRYTLLTLDSARLTRCSSPKLIIYFCFHHERALFYIRHGWQ